MTNLAYVVQGINFRELSKSDVSKYLDEDSDAATKLRFEHGVPQEVDDEVADVLLNHADFEGEFVEITDEENPEGEAEKATAKAAKKAAKKTAASQPGPGASSETTGSTGRGTSTGGTGTTAGSGSTGRGTSTGGSTT